MGIVLVIDDTLAAHDLIGRWLAEERLRLARALHRDAITLDVRMPGMAS
jgi:CheY-like chemotaxis protein